MNVLSGIRATREQRFRTRDENGTVIILDLRYSSVTQAWFMDVRYNDFVINGLRLVNTLNLLHQFQRQIPFGMAILVTDDGDPFLINDFSTERVQIGILTSAEVQEVNSLYSGIRDA